MVGCYENSFFETIKNDGINVIEDISEQSTPIALTSDKVRIRVFAPSERKRNGIAPAKVVPVVASNAGIFRLSVKYKSSEVVFFVIMFFCRSPSAQRIAALTVMPLPAINAHATAELYAPPEITRHSAGIDSETGIAARITSGKVKDSFMEAIIM